MGKLSITTKRTKWYRESNLSPLQAFCLVLAIDKDFITLVNY